MAVYSLLRYGVPVKTEVGRNTETVKLINWEEPTKNDFAIAEEVTVCGNHEKRPDIVLYINGIAIGVLELKNSRVSIGDGIRQSIVNQQPEFIGSFFSTVQFVFAGNDSEGLRYQIPGGASATADSFSPFWKGVKEDGLELAIKIDETIKRTRPDDWRGVQAREQVVKASLYGVLQNEDEVERIFLIIKQQKEY